MAISCMILLAGVCFPTQPQQIEVIGGIVGTVATVTRPGYVAHVELTTDLVGKGPGLVQHCTSAGCVEAKTERRTDDKAHTCHFELWRGRNQSIVVIAPTQDGLAKALEDITLQIGPGPTDAWMPLSALAAAN